MNHRDTETQRNIANCQLPIANCQLENQLAIGNWQLAIGNGFFALVLVFVGVRGLSAQEDKKPPPPADYKRLLLQAEDEYRRFFNRPKTIPQFWAAMKFEMDTGKFDLAALHLKLMLDEIGKEFDPDQKKFDEKIKKKNNEALAKIEEAHGLFSFLRLQTVPLWSKNAAIERDAKANVQVLIDRVTQALDDYLGDPERIHKFIKNLDARTVEERTFAFAKLQRAKERAVPYLVQALRTNKVGSTQHARVREAMVALDREIVPPLLEVFKARTEQDFASVDLRVTLLDIMQRRGDKRAIPYLWHMSGSPRYPAAVQAKAEITLAYLLETSPEKLPPAKQALVELAERFYQHKVKFVDPKHIRIWPWDGQALATKPVVITTSQAEEYFGLRYATEALDLDKAYQPAQVVFLNLTLERTLEPKLTELLFEPLPPNLHRLLATIDADLLIAVLERALTDGKVPIILATVQALGERGEVRAARHPGDGPPRGVLRALYYPDRRVQFAALKAMLRMPANPLPIAAARLVDVLRRFTAAEATPEAMPKALLAYAPLDKVNLFRKALQEAKFDAKSAANIKEGMNLLQQSADFDLIVLHHQAGENNLRHALAQLRGDWDHGLLPILLIAGKNNLEDLNRLAERHRHVAVLTEIQATMPERIKEAADNLTKAALGAALTAKERQEFKGVSLDVLWRMARNEIPGYDIRPALPAVDAALRHDDLAVQALEIYGRLPGVDLQQRLAAVVLDPLLRGKLRVTAAKELNRHLQKYGLLLTRDQIGQIKTAQANAKEDPEVRAQLAVTVGSFRPSGVLTGSRLLQYEGDQPPEKKGNGKEKEKEKGKEK